MFDFAIPPPGLYQVPMAMDRHSPQAAAIRGILWMLAAGVLSAVTAGLVRHLSGAFSAVELVLFRTLVGLFLLAPWLLYKGVGSLRTGRLPLYSLRTVFAYLAMVMSFYALAHIPLAEVYALQFTIPLFTIMLAVLLLGQRAGMGSWIACLVGFSGALVIVRPGFVELSVAAVLALVSALMSAGSNTTIKMLSRTESPEIITVYANLLMLPLALIPSLFVWVTPSWEQAPWLICLGLAGSISGYCFTRSVAAADARIVQPFQFMRMLFAALVGYVVFTELPGSWTWLGAVIIFASSTYIIRREAGARQKSARP